MDVGSRLKAARQMKGLSQRSLARLSGVNNGTISLIEQNKVSPSVSSLKRLLKPCSMSLGEFFDDQTFEKEKFFFRAGELTEFQSGDVVFRQIKPNIPGRKMQVMHERYLPKGDTGERMLTHAGEEAGFVLKGTVEVTVGNETVSLSAGEAYYFDSSIPHRFRNQGDEECEIVSVCTPPSF
ncbi:MAG: cupin domain-containing protein [Chromatiaceae bacterium]|nr:cupin domain-containing protein [Gammaproteobacteria bacterium]MCP5318655.1 cupin domain-containing protein [Chromatiaceae bacterium]MCP5435292.1 cupin domain-containing protein [Chromatiaceae bacterium]HOP15091.1 cupin domain-containing protein [Gammaproteobacteria bacterium]HPQ24349.1 cupin domain-containing protein [Gammaproteobacteria bacterium]